MGDGAYKGRNAIAFGTSFALPPTAPHESELRSAIRSVETHLYGDEDGWLLGGNRCLGFLEDMNCFP